MTGKPSYRLLTFTQECSFQWKNPFFLVHQHKWKATFFQNWPAQITKIIVILKLCWPSETET